MLKNKKILVLAPHTDDGELGCGGTIAKAIEENAEVYYVAFSTAEPSVPKGFPKDRLKVEVKKATKKLGIPKERLIIYNYEVRKLNYVRQDLLEQLVKLAKSIQPDIVFMPGSRDTHQDHLTVHLEGIRAFKHTTILGYELIWNNLSFSTDCFVELEKRHLKKKKKALREYKTQIGKRYMSAEFINGLARVRGVQIGAKYAEAFEVIRWIIK